jgi:hypothetical protein
MFIFNGSLISGECIALFNSAYEPADEDANE